MEVQVEEATENPEELVCRAARNDYSEHGIQDRSFADVMEEISIDGKHVDDINNEWGLDLQPSEDWTTSVESLPEDVKIEARKRTLIHRLLQHGHFGPFEHPQITFSVNGISRSLMAQITRHRHASFDIQSMRYVSFEDADPEPGEACVAIPELDDPGLAGRNAEFDDAFEGLDDDVVLGLRQEKMERAYEVAFNCYQDLLKLGTAPENARMVLPIGTKVNMVFSVNARMLMHIADMRAAADAQWEIREMTEEVLDLAAEWCPITFEYYDEEMRNRKNRLAP